MNKPFPAYQGDDPYVFVSYAHDDADLVFPALMAEQGIDDEWRRELMETANSIEDITGIHVAPDEDY